MDNDKKLPFPVRRNTWKKDHYAVITRVKVSKWPYGEVNGIYHFNGEPKTETPETISSAGCYQWDFADFNDFQKPVYQGKQKPIRLYYKNDGFDFGRYFNKVSHTSISTIKEVFISNPGYIKWCIENVDHFCLFPEDLNELNPTDPQMRIGRKFRKINHQKYEKLTHKTSKNQK